MNPSERVTVGVAVVIDRGRVLVGRRAPSAVDQPGRDEFPGGLAEPGETAAAAAERECLEEAAVAVVAEDLLGREEVVSSRGVTEILFYRCRVLADARPTTPFDWLPVAALAHCDFPAANRGVVARLLGERS